MLMTYTGKPFDYNNIKKQDIDLKDIIHSLSNINRFNGHSSRPYSVLEHTFMCLLMAEKLKLSTRQKLLVLIHDFAEAYVGDCPAPLKYHLPEFIKIEARVEKAILEKFKIVSPTLEEYKIIKSIDLSMLAIEMRDLTKHNYTIYTDEYTHKQFLKDDDFNIVKEISSREMLKGIVSVLFTSLLEDYHEELEDE